MITMVLPADASNLCLGATVEAMREMDIGGRLMRDIKRRLRTTLLNAESVRPVGEGFVSLEIYCFEGGFLGS